MSKPIHNAPTMPLSFEQRLKLVSSEIVNRTNNKPVNQRNATRARLWVRWIHQNLLIERKPQQAHQPKQLFNCDLYPHRTRNEAVEATA